MSCKVEEKFKELTKLLNTTVTSIGIGKTGKITAATVIAGKSKSPVTHAWAEAVKAGKSRADTLYSMKSAQVLLELHDVDVSRQDTEDGLWVMRNGTPNFGNPFYTVEPKNKKPGDMLVEGNGTATAAYYLWLKDGLLPEGADAKALETRRTVILANLDKVNNADKLRYSGTAVGNQINHVTALTKIAEDKLGKVPKSARVKTPKTSTKAPTTGSPSNKPVKSDGVQTYEVSTKGDKRFSALVARLKDGRTIEEAFQLDVKGYRSKGNDWRLGKGKPPLDKSLNLQDEYTKLWQQFFEENPKLFAEISSIVESGTWLTDQFAGKGVNQADTIAGIVNSNWSPKGKTSITIVDKNWTRASAEADNTNVYIFGDNTADKRSKYVPKATQAVVRALPNAFGIDTKKSRTEQFTEADYDKYVKYLDKVFKALEDMKAQGRTFVVSKDGIGTGKANLPAKLHNEMAKRFNAFVGQDLVPEKVVENVEEQVPWHDDSVAEPMVVEKTSRKKVGTVTVPSGEVIEIWRVPTEELTKPDGTELAAVYNSSAKTGAKAAIYLNSSKKLWNEYFDNKNWTKPREQKDGSFAQPIREDAFKSIKELRDFVIQHEIGHNTLGKRTKDLTIGQYETNVNNEAARVMGITLYDQTIETEAPFDVDEPTKPVKRQKIEEIEELEETTPKVEETKKPLDDNPRYLLQGKFQANEGQRALIDNTVAFVNSDKPGISNNVIVIQGKGGTGKSTTIGRAIELANNELKGGSVTMVGMTFTHAAKGVLKDMTKGMNISADVGTFASQLGLLGFSTTVATRKEGPITTHIALTGKNSNARPPKIMNTITDTLGGFVGDNKLVIVVDEASMTTNKDYEMLMDLADMYEGSLKVILMGDYHQLTPINGEVGNKTPLNYNPQRLSPSSLITLGVASSATPWLAENEKKIAVHTLTEQQRQSVDSSLYKAITMASNKVDQQLGIPLEPVSELTEDGSVEFLTIPQVPKIVRSLFSKENYKSAKYINFNNKNVADFNRKVREVIFGDKAKEEYVAGEEQVILYDNGDTQQEYTNGRNFIVESVQENVTSNRVFQVDDGDILLEYKDNVPLVRLTLSDDVKSFKIVVPKGLTERVVSIVSGKETFTPSIVKASGEPRQPAKDIKGVYTQLLLEYMDISKKGKAAQYSKGPRALKDETIEELLTADNLFVPFTYSYGITTYKSQGQTIDNVLYDADNDVFGGDFGSATELYTGLSRAKKKLYFIGDQSVLGLDPKYMSANETLKDVNTIEDITPGSWGSDMNIYQDNIPFGRTTKEPDTAEYQHTSDLKKRSEDELVFNTIKTKLVEMYPEITARQVDSLYDNNGVEVLGRAIGGVVEYVKDPSLDTLPHEYAHIYINLLEKTTFMDNTLAKISKEYGLSREQSKEKLATLLGQDFVSKIKGGTEPKVPKTFLQRVWDKIRSFFAKSNIQEVTESIDAISQRFYDGVNKEAIRLTPMKGFEKVDTEATFKDQPFAGDVLKTVMEAAKGDAQFTGSAALALQGDIYRKGENGITDLHDLDFAVKNVDVLKQVYGKLWRTYTTAPVYQFVVQYIKGEDKEYMVKTLLVTDRIYKIPEKDMHYRGSRLQRYKIRDNNGKVVGTYNATIEDIDGKAIITKESTTGVKAVIVDLIEDPTKDEGVVYNSPVLNTELTLSTPQSTFDAKNSMEAIVPRDKDVRDFNTFYKGNKSTTSAELKNEYRGKVILANSGTGKSYASSLNSGVVDSDNLLASILNTTQDGIVDALSKSNKDTVYSELRDKILEEIKKGNTVLTPSTHPSIMSIADIAIIQNDAYAVQTNSNSSDRNNPLSRSLASAKSSIALFKKNIGSVESIVLSPNEYITNEIYNTTQEPAIITDNIVVDGVPDEAIAEEVARNINSAKKCD